MHVVLVLLQLLLMLPSALSYIAPTVTTCRRKLHTSLVAPISMTFQSPDTSYPYIPPKWAKDKLTKIPKHGRLHLANLPTPIHQVKTNNASKNSVLSKLNELNISLFVKRDDATGGVELGG